MRRAVIAIAVIAAIPVLLWCLVTLFLSIGVPVLASGPKAVIHVRAAWLDLSGNVVVDRLHVESGTDHDHWWVDVDHVTAEVDPQGLRNKIFKAKNVHANAASFHYESKGMVEPGGPSQPAEKKWTIQLDDVTVDDASELAMGAQRLVNAGRATGDLTVDPKTGDVVRNAMLEVDDARFFIGEDQVMSSLKGQIGITVDQFLPRDNPGQQALGFVSGNAQLVGTLTSLAFVGSYFESTPWVQFAGGSGPLDIDLKLTRGEVEVGSRMHVTAEGIQGRLFSYTVTGNGTVDVDAIAGVEGAKGAAGQDTLTKVLVAFDDFTIQQDGEKTPHLQGKGLVVTAKGPTELDRPPQSLDVVVDLPDSKIPDLRVYNGYLPTGAGISIAGGTGRAKAHLEVGAVDKIGHGTIELVTDEAKVKIDDVVLIGDFALSAKVPNADFDKGRYEIGGTRFTWKDVSVTGTDKAKNESWEWWANLDVPRGHVLTKEEAEVFLDATLVLHCRDSIPFIAILSSQKPIPGWARGMLATDDVEGKARVQLGDNLVRIQDLEVTGGSTEVKLEATKRKGKDIDGIAFASYRSLAIGLRMHDSKQEIQIKSPRKWYDGLAEAN
jgi:hypothetical protein